MPFSLNTKQVAGVTGIVGLAVLALTAWYLSSLATIRLEEAGQRASLLANAIYQRAGAVVAAGADPIENLRSDAGLRSILEASAYGNTILYAAVLDKDGAILAISIGPADQPLPPADDLDQLLQQNLVARARALYAPTGRMYEVRRPLLLLMPDGTTHNFGSIRVGISTLLLSSRAREQFRAPLITAAVALVAALVVAMFLAQIVLRPIHVLRSGLARLGRGELDVAVDLPQDGDFGDLGASFKAVSARLAADRTELDGQRATLESVVAHLEDAVALFSPDGTLLFANPAMRAALGGDAGSIASLLPARHPYRTAVEDTLAGLASEDPVVVDVPGGGARLVLTRPVTDTAGHAMGAMLVSRNLAYLTQVESTLAYSRKLASLGRLSAGVAHEIKNPLNATMIHLELLKMGLADQPAALEHVGVIAAQVRRLDEVVHGFIKFMRPEDLRLAAAPLAAILDPVLPVIRAEAGASGVDVRVECPADLPPVSADAHLLGQAFLNLGLNACQAMPDGGRLWITAAARPGRRLEIVFEDTGAGIAPEDLPHIFDLYFTTKTHGSGIGLSLVYRTIQMHDGEISVESVPGRGTTFRVLLHQAAEISRPAPAAAAS